jgi:very-short-patch-repair endonuclease
MYRDAEQRDFARRLRNQMTPAERSLWRTLRADQLRGLRFRRQASIGGYTVDFACFSHKLIIELDGPQHAETQARGHDSRRDDWLRSQGFQILRFWNHELDDSHAPVIHAVLKAIEPQRPAAVLPLSPALSTRERGPEG